MPAATAAGSVLDRGLELVPDVSVRPEAFGALLYSFGTRRLSFLKDRRLLAVLQALPASSTAREACATAGIGEHELPAYDQALLRLVRTDMLRERAA